MFDIKDLLAGFISCSRQKYEIKTLENFTVDCLAVDIKESLFKSIIKH